MGWLHRDGLLLTAALHVYIQVDAMAATQTSHRRLLAQSDDGKGNKQLPSSNSTARYMPRLSDECYQLAALAHTPKFERSPDFATAAYGLLEASLGRVQEATGLPTLAQDSKTGQVAVSLTGGWCRTCTWHTRCTHSLGGPSSCAEGAAVVCGVSSVQAGRRWRGWRRWWCC